MAAYKVSLVIGGTGMLAQATRWLAARSETTVVVARRASAFVEPPGQVAVDADWSSPVFVQDIEAAIAGHGAVETALLWLHEPGLLLPRLSQLLATARVVLVLGSLDGQPAIPEAAKDVAMVRLGSLATPGGRRWLTHEEISDGAIASLQDGLSRTIGELNTVS